MIYINTALNLALIIAVSLKYNGFIYLAQDKIDSKETSYFKKGLLSYDKIQHFLWGFTFLLIDASMLNMGLVIVSMILWEVKDGLYDYKQYGKLGGDGFSFLDLFAGFMGVSFGFALIQIVRAL